MNTKHTRGPWRVVTRTGKAGFLSNPPHIDDAAGNAVAMMGAGSIHYGNAEANAARIVACVNACEGINPEAVPELLAALRAAMKAVDEGAAFIPAHVGMKASAAIAKAEGR